MDLTEMYNYPYDVRLDLIYSRLAEFCSSETDEEIIEYDDFLLDSLQEVSSYITLLEKRVVKPKIPLEKVEELNMKYANNDPFYKAVINFRTTEDVRDELVNLANESDTTLEKYMRDLVDCWLEGLPK